MQFGAQQNLAFNLFREIFDTYIDLINRERKKKFEISVKMEINILFKDEFGGESGGGSGGKNRIWFSGMLSNVKGGNIDLGVRVREGYCYFLLRETDWAG